MEKRNWIIVALCVAIIGMGIGFAAMAANLEVGGTADIVGDWRVQFRTFQPAPGNQGATQRSLTFTPGTTTATFHVDLEHPGATFTYDIVIENDGSIPARFVNVMGLTEANAVNPGVVVWTLNNEPAPNAPLAANGGTHTMTLTVEWISIPDAEEIPAITNHPITLTFNYVQNTN